MGNGVVLAADVVFFLVTAFFFVAFFFEVRATIFLEAAVFFVVFFFAVGPLATSFSRARLGSGRLCFFGWGIRHL